MKRLLALLLALSIPALAQSPFGPASGGINRSTGGGTVATPTLSIPGGTYTTAQSPVISDATSGSTIYCSIDSSTPTATSVTIAGASTPCTSAIQAVTSGAQGVVALAPFTLKTLAKKSGLTDSAINTAAYTLTLGQDGTAGAAQGTATGTASHTCATDLTATGTYYLDADMTCAGHAFLVDANNITLNLNGHTITYNTGGSGNTKGTPAILLADSFYTGFNVTGTTSNHANFTLYGGTITESATSHTESPALAIGQASSWNNPTVHHVVFNTVANDSQAIWFDNQGAINTGGINFHDNTFHMAATVTSSRYQYLGYCILVGGSAGNLATSLSNTISHNSFTACTQGAIAPNYQNAVMQYNDIYYNSTTTNDFGIIGNASSQTISFNNIHPLNGRGIHVIAPNITVAFNYLSTHESTGNVEYSGCELGGAFGIQIEFDNTVFPTEPTGVSIHDNYSVTQADNCNAAALRFSTMSAASSLTLANNSFVSTHTTGPGLSYAMSENEEYGTGATTTWTKNYFKADSAYLLADSDGANGTIWSGQTWAGTPAYIFDNHEFPQLTLPSAFGHTWSTSDTISATIPVSNCTTTTSLLTTTAAGRTAGICATTTAVTGNWASRSNATPRVNPGFLGVNTAASSLTDATSLATLNTDKLNVTRIFSNEYETYNSSGTVNWTYMDGRLTRAQANGLKVVLDIHGTMHDLTTGCTGGACDCIPPNNNATYASRMADLVHHIDVNYPGLVTFYEFMNEPDGLTDFCPSPLTQAGAITAWSAMYAPSYTAMKAQAATDGVSIMVGGPALAAPGNNTTQWFTSAGNILDTVGASNFDFISFHIYMTGTNWSSWPLLYARMQSATNGFAYYYKTLETAVRAKGFTGPIIITEYNDGAGFSTDCCREDAVYSPIYNSLSIADMLNAVNTSGAVNLPTAINLYAAGDHWFCVFGNTTLTDCTQGSPEGPMPPYYAYKLFTAPGLLNMQAGGYMVSSISPASTTSGLSATGFYTASPNRDSAVMVNPTATDALATVNFQNPGLTPTVANVYVLNTNNPTIYSTTATLANSSGTYSTSILVPAYSTVAVSIQ